MFADDKIGIGYGLMGLLQDDAKFVTFNGKAWILDETALTKHLKAISAAGANFARFLPWGVWGSHPGQKKAYQFQPYFLDTSRDKWDLSAFNTHYFPIVKRVIEIINGLNMTVMFCLFDACQFHGGYSKWSPWVSNVQGITTLYDPAADVYTKRWVSTMTLRFKDADVIWAFGNEMNNAAFPAFAKRVIFPYIKLRNLDFNRMTYGATMMSTAYLGNHQYEDKYCPLDYVKRDVGDVFGDEAKLDVYREIHGCGGIECGAERPFGADVDQALLGWGKNPIRKIFSDDGCYTGNSKCDKRDKGARPSAETWGKMATYILANYPVTMGGRDRLINFEHLPGVYPPNDICQAATIRAISTAYHNKWGVWPKNWGKHPT